MNEQLQIAEENAFDPLLLMDDLIDTMDSEHFVADVDDELVNKKIDNIEKKIQPTPAAFQSNSTLPPFQLNQELLFRELVQQHQKRLFRFVIKYIDHPDDAADITQQAFVEAARTIASFRGDSKLSTWLFGIAMNMVRNYPKRLFR